MRYFYISLIYIQLFRSEECIYSVLELPVTCGEYTLLLTEYLAILNVSNS
jgi:hypothetical protein